MPDKPTYRVDIAQSAAKEMRSLPLGTRLRIVAAIEGLSHYPRPRGCAKLKGSDGNLYRIRVGVYRIVYEIDDTQRILDITRVRHRREVYDQ